MKKTSKVSKKKSPVDLKGAGKVGLAAAVAVIAGMAIAKALKKDDKTNVQKLIDKLKSL